MSQLFADERMPLPGTQVGCGIDLFPVRQGHGHQHIHFQGTAQAAPGQPGGVPEGGGVSDINVAFLIVAWAILAAGIISICFYLYRNNNKR